MDHGSEMATAGKPLDGVSKLLGIWGKRGSLGSESWEIWSVQMGPHITDTTWYLIVDWLTPSEAIQEYGEIAQVVLGPHKGFRSVTFGKTTFISPRLNPLVHAINVSQEKISILPKGDRRLVVNETK